MLHLVTTHIGVHQQSDKILLKPISKSVPNTWTAGSDYGICDTRNIVPIHTIHSALSFSDFVKLMKRKLCSSLLSRFPKLNCTYGNKAAPKIIFFHCVVLGLFSPPTLNMSYDPPPPSIVRIR